MMANLLDLKNSILADGKIDADEVQQIKKAIYEDGKIDTDEANFLFDLNNACSGANNDNSWAELFVASICDYLLNDETSPGIVDEAEAKWLIQAIGADGKVDGLEKQLLQELSSRAKSIPDSLQALINNSI